MHCLWCNERIIERVSWRHLFGLQQKDPLCEPCRQSLTIISGEICRGCGRMIELTPAEYVSHFLCLDCERWEEDDYWTAHPFSNRSLYVYNESMQQLLSLFKFRGDVKVIEAVKHEWKTRWEQGREADFIVPIPLSAERLYERGFNQSLYLARMLTEDVADLLIRPYHLEKQSKKTRAERVLAQNNIFALKERSAVSGKSVLLIDDVYTTGATVRSAAKTLYDAGAINVSAYTLARA